MLKVAIIGTGQMAQKHARALAAHPEVSPFLICSTERSMQRSHAFQEEFGFKKQTTDVHAVLQDGEVEAIVIASPDHTHAEFVIRGLEAGKHVLCEKPLACSAGEFELLEKAKETARTVLQVGMNCRYRTPYMRPREMARELGALRFIRGTYLLNKIAAVRDGSKPWWGEKREETYFFLHANGVHILDLMRWFGGEVKNVFAREACLELSDFHADTFSISLEFCSGLLGEVLLSIASLQPREVEIQTWHDKGTIRNGKLYKREGDQIASEPEILNFAQPVLDLDLQLDDFLKAVAQGGEPMNSLAEAKAN
ncbi:MAG: Gfo/Idh/MocA family oxidoreductase, partial [Candidatus Eremiobacteraeota bacterium]|nr:Gfo/Idh/MocA family oxidoreductase [Candidatus Eremiobacteraeota bacterium]